MGATAVREVSAVKAEAQELLDAYVQCLDDDRVEEWPDFFTEDAVYKIVARENVERNLPVATMSCTSKGMMLDRVVALRNASVFSPRYLRHLVSGLRILGEEGGAYVFQANFAVFQTLQDEETKVFLLGKYRGKLIFSAEGELKLREMLAIYDTSQIPGLLAVPV